MAVSISVCLLHHKTYPSQGVTLTEIWPASNYRCAATLRGPWEINFIQEIVKIWHEYEKYIGAHCYMCIIIAKMLLVI